MPKKQCKEKGKTGVKYGDSGKCYTGKDKESKMRRQAAAINISKAKKKRK